MSRIVDERIARRRQAELVASLRRLAGPGAPAPGPDELPPSAANGARVPAVTVTAAAEAGPGARAASPRAREAQERCDLCGNPIGADHRHLLDVSERRILCACESCIALRSGDPDLRPTSTRVVRLHGFDLPEEVWASFSIPIGLAFLVKSSAAGGVAALYPSPAGATESELDLAAWDSLERANPVLASLEPDAEALIVNRIADPHRFAIAPIDRCYELVGMIKMGWEGISGGSGVEEAIERFFAELREQ